MGKRENFHEGDCLYIAIGIVVMELASGLGNKGASKPAYTQPIAKTNGAQPCLVNLEKFNAMKDGMSYFQIERDIGCSGIQDDLSHRRPLDNVRGHVERHGFFRCKREGSISERPSGRQISNTV